MKLISYFLLFVSIAAIMVSIWMMYMNVKERLPIIFWVLSFIFWVLSFIALISAIVALVGSFALIYLTEG